MQAVTWEQHSAKIGKLPLGCAGVPSSSKRPHREHLNIAREAAEAARLSGRAFVLCDWPVEAKGSDGRGSKERGITGLKITKNINLKRPAAQQSTGAMPTRRHHRNYPPTWPKGYCVASAGEGVSMQFVVPPAERESGTNRRWADNERAMGEFGRTAGK